MGAKGLKKIDNFKKKQDEINMWKRNSNADDVEYMECQMEMEQQLQQSYPRTFGCVAHHRLSK